MVQLASNLDTSLESLQLKGYVLEPKLDGYRATISFDGEKVEVTGRSGTSWTGYVPDLEYVVSKSPVPFVLDGEIGVPDGTIKFQGQEFPMLSFSKTASVFKSSRVKAQLRNSEVVFVAFDAISFQTHSGGNVPDSERRLVVEYLVKFIDSFRVQVIPRWEHWELNWPWELAELGTEGAMLKNPKATYRSARTSQWVKVKVTDTEDVVIMGWEVATEGKLTGMLRHFEYGQYRDGELVSRGTCGGGMDDATRKRLTRYGDRLIGKVVELKKFKDEGGDGGFRHPQYVRLRDDKSPEECEWT